MSLLQENITALTTRSTQLIDLANSPAEVLRHIDFAPLLQERYQLLADFKRQALAAQHEAIRLAAQRDWADRAIRTLRNDLTGLCETHKVTLIEQDQELAITVTDDKWAKQLARFTFPLNYNTWPSRSWRSTEHPGHYVEVTMDSKTRRYTRNESTGTMRWEKIVTAIRTMLDSRDIAAAAVRQKQACVASQLERVIDDVAGALTVTATTERVRDPWSGNMLMRERDVIKGSADHLSVDFHNGPDQAGLYMLTIHTSHIDGHRLAALLRVLTEKEAACEQEA